MAPLRVLQGVDLFVTRRVNDQRMRLRPGRKTNWIVEYLVAVLAEKYGIAVHAICAMSDHWHLVLNDRLGKIDLFTRDCHHHIAKAVNAVFGDRGSLWDSRQTDRPRLATPEDVKVQIAYTMANPVKHGAVKFGRNWPGVRRRWPAPAKRIKRPPFYFTDERDEKGALKWPEEAFLVMERPAGFEHLTDEQLDAELQIAIDAAEEGFRIERAEKGLGYMGRRACLRRDRWGRAESNEKRRRRRNPTVICRDPKLAETEYERWRTWLAEYAAALASWRAGDRDVVFPHGTHKMRALHDVNVAPPPP